MTAAAIPRPSCQSEAQQLYDECGTIKLAAARLDLHPATVWTMFTKLGVKMNGRGEYARKNNARLMHHCETFGRNCVIFDLPGSCPACKASRSVESVVAGASSAWTTEIRGAGR